MTEHDGRGGASPAAVALIVARLYRQLAQASADDLNLTYAQLSALARIEQFGPIRLGEPRRARAGRRADPHAYGAAAGRGRVDREGARPQ